MGFWLIVVKTQYWDADPNPVPCFRYLSRRNPTKRHYVLSSSATTEKWQRHNPHLNDGYLNDPSNDAFLIWVFENGYTKWKASLVLDDFKKELKATKPSVSDAEFEKQVDQEIRRLGEKLDTPFTTANGGRAHYGGVTKKGMLRYQELVKAVVKNRKERADEIKEIEMKILKEVRARNNRDEIDRKRAAKKNKKPKSQVVEIPDVDPNFQADDLDQWF